MSESAEMKIANLESMVQTLTAELAATKKKIKKMSEEIDKLTEQNLFQQISLDTQNENIEELQATSIEMMFGGK